MSGIPVATRNHHWIYISPSESGIPAVARNLLLLHNYYPQQSFFPTFLLGIFIQTFILEEILMFHNIHRIAYKIPYSFPQQLVSYQDHFPSRKYFPTYHPQQINSYHSIIPDMENSRLLFLVIPYYHERIGSGFYPYIQVQEE